jgi:hypothetical protein
MRTITCLVSLFISWSSFSQKSPIKFGEIPIEDMRMTIYDRDSSAAAVVLVDYGEANLMFQTQATSTANAARTTSVQFKNTPILNYKRHVRLKILNKEGLQWADVIIPLFGSGSRGQKVLDLKASTFNLESGKIVETEMSKEGVFKENFTQNINVKKFTLPNVKEGSVIEYSYRFTSPSTVAIPTWEFQRKIPVRLSEFWALIPEYYIFEKNTLGYLLPTTFEEKYKEMAGYSAKSLHWVTKSIPAFKVEPYMTSEQDYISRVNFSITALHYPGQPVQEIMGSWQSLVKSLQKDDDFGQIIGKFNFLKDDVERITAGISDPMKKIEAVHKYVRETIEWDGTKNFMAGNLKQIVEKKKGGSADINFLLASMLDKAGFLVDMVILSTRDHGFVRIQSPAIQQFNYVICAVRVAGKPIFLDATEKYLPMNVLPIRCLNGQGLMISDISPGWIDLTSLSKAKTTVDAELSLENTGDFKGKLRFIRDGYDAFEMRKKYYSKGEEAYLSDSFKAGNWQINQSQFKNMSELNQPAQEIHDVTIQEHALLTGDVMYINPFLSLKEGSNPFRSESREYPVDFGSPIEKMYIIKIALPEGFFVEELPESRILKLPNNTARFTFSATQAGNLISVISNFQINKSLFVPSEYPDLREFYNQVISKQAEQIVLKKNNRK